ncbi:MAG TPA: EAL domain-containing protein [Usitatibacter sp.]|nr:EAL domain-containing protein [Usitatibacter sp.]
MRILDMKDYTAGATLYWWSVTTLGAVGLAIAAYATALLPPSMLLQALIGAAVAAFVGLFPVRIPGSKTAIAAGEIFIFLVLLLYGPAPAVVAAAVEGFIASCRASKRWTSRIGTPAMIALAMLGCANFLEDIRATTVLDGAGTAVLLSTLLGFALLYYVSITLLTSTLFALKSRSAFTPIRWLKKLGWMGFAYMASASVAGLLYLTFARFGLPVLLVAVPLIAMFLSTLHFYFQRKDADERHMEELRASESRFHSAFTHAAIGMALVSTEGQFVHTNKAFCDMLGLANGELDEADLRRLVHQDDIEPLKELIDKMIAGKLNSAHTEVRGRHRDGSDVWMSLNLSLARDWQFRNYNLIVQAQDITARRRAEAELFHNAYHDNLTQLHNRTHFMEQLNRAIARAGRSPQHQFAVMYLDFDRFKMVNDSLGHKAGDELLVNVARRMKGVLRPNDLLARLGGDEFGILMEDMHSERDAVELTERIQREVQKPFLLGTMEVSISASIGITFGANGYESSDQIIRDADIAMYKAKSNGKAQYAIFDASLHAQVSTQLKLENDLRKALGSGQICLEYQPICALRDRRLIGFEALVRWNHPERGVLQPSSFIPTAEETGLIVPLGNWVLSEACRQMHEWRHIAGSATLGISINVSSLQLSQPGFVNLVRQALEAAQMRPSQLTLEVTESVLMDGIDHAVETLRELRNMGITLSIDDFGTGYSSLSYLAKLPIDALKIDRSFVERMGTGEDNEIVKAIFKLGQTLGKRVYAEGIETGDQLARLEQLGCQYGQGFLLSRPVNAARANTFVANDAGLAQTA